MNALIKKIRNQIDFVRSSLDPKISPPDELLGELFQDVQIQRIYPDGMIFADMLPAEKLNKILKIYKEERHDPAFDLADFVQKHFSKYLVEPDAYITNPDHNIEQHINALWPVLKRESYKNTGSLIGLPCPYVVSGGRFSAQFYWDSYFTMLGLVVAKDWRMVENMTKNCAYLIRKLGFVPNGSRTYFTSRSQPPFFALMVRLLATHEGKFTLVRYLPSMLAEHKFWMIGAKKARFGRNALHLRLARMSDGTLLNRYYDNKSNPRPESYKEDVVTALAAKDHRPSRVYLDLRAAAESGWDFSARWLKDHKTLETIRTTDIVPVDLNCLMVVLEQTIAMAYDVLLRPRQAAKYRAAAEKRSAAINKYMWDQKRGFYFDYDFLADKPDTVVSCAGLFPLYVQIASKEQAKKVAAITRRELLKKGGLLATTINTGQQWDAPNGWAPLHWVAIKGLRAYDLDELANDVKRRWILTVNGAFKDRKKLVEKYNVVDPGKVGGGGEYALQDGFGWTNGVMLALLHEDKLKLD